MSWELALGFLPFLILLACPLAMWWMMRGMSHGESCGKEANPHGEAPQAAAVPVEGAEHEIRLLKERLARLESEQRDGREPWK